ncbi:MAG: DUF2764 domain-containing protein [Massilibacteroides sp.]|nr:DUF2764 domain-containing protein [Massilibacteroides sp.]
MSKYYCLIAGLPDVSLEDSKQTYSVTEFRDEISEQLSKRDKKVIDLFFRKYDNANIVGFLQNPTYTFDEKGFYTAEQMVAVMTALKNDEISPDLKMMPAYLADFIRTYLAREDKPKETQILWADRLASIYYAFATKSKKTFVGDWYELNLNINNILTAFTCRAHGLDRANYIVGDNLVSKALRTSNARDFGLGDEIDYIPALQKIVEEKDLIEREKKVDVLKWKWLEDHTFFKTFDIESVFAYLVKLDLIDRWVSLDKVTGEKTFRQLVGTMKKGSDNTLAKFKKNNNK